MYMNDDKYKLVKIFETSHVYRPGFLNEHLLIYLRKEAETSRMLVVVFHFGIEAILSQLRVGVRYVADCAFLGDGR